MNPKFEALSTIEKFRKTIELLGEALSIIDDIQPIVKSPVCDQLCEIGEDINLILTRLSKLGSDETRESKICYWSGRW